MKLEGIQIPASYVPIAGHDHVAAKAKKTFLASAVSFKSDEQRKNEEDHGQKLDSDKEETQKDKSNDEKPKAEAVEPHVVVDVLA